MRRIVLGIIGLLIGSVIALLIGGGALIGLLRDQPTEVIPPLLGIFPSLGALITRVIAESAIGTIVGTVLALLLRERAGRAAGLVGGQPGRAAALGLGAWFTLPALLGTTWVGALILFNLWALGLDAFAGITAAAADKFVTTVGAGAFMLLLWTGRTIAGAALARALLARQLWRGESVAIAVLVFGGAIGGALVALPFVGWAIGLASSVVGIGALLLTLQRRDPMRTAYLPAETASSDALRLPPPITDDPPRGPGMDNLPSGFTWWE